MRRLGSILKQVPLALAAPLLALVSLGSLWLLDALWLLFGRRRPPADTKPATNAASVVIPNWNGRDLLEKYLPSVVEAMSGNPRNEIIVVDNGSTDGSAEFVRTQFPAVRLLALPRNLGFGGGSNYGFTQASNDIVVLLNSDMRVDPGFLPPLLNAFTGERVFAVSCQIYFSDPGKLREETGLTQAWWAQGSLRVRHRIDDAIQQPFPCFYGGGGSCAFDRRKFLELGGFDEVYRPFYLEDTDLGFRAWKRGWKVLYQPVSHVWHEHRGTIGKNFQRSYIDGIIKKNLLLFAWTNIHEPKRLLGHFVYSLTNAWLSALVGDSPERTNLIGLARAFLSLPRALRSRWKARALAVVDDREAFRRPLAGYFRDRFLPLPDNPSRLNVLFVSPYPVCPPTHGGGVFMNQTIRQLGRLANVHLIALVDEPREADAHVELNEACASMEFLVRLEGQPKGAGSLVPFAVREFSSAELEWLIHRQIYQRQVDVVQLEYTVMGQYAGPFLRIPVILFEHDVYFQSIARGLGRRGLSAGLVQSCFEYLRALRYELRLLPKLDRIQTCTAENKQVLLSYLPELRGRIDDHVRAGIDVSRYAYRSGGREEKTMLFLGSFRHLPNLEALNWLLQRVMPRILADEPEARLVIVGSDPPPAYSLPDYGGAVQLAGFVPDVREPLSRYALFLCPILTGSGVRVKLLEAFAAGIPAVSTTLGAEGLCAPGNQLCALADTPDQFARETIRLLRQPDEAAAMARRARTYVENQRDMPVLARNLEQTYRQAIRDKRALTASSAEPVSPTR